MKHSIIDAETREDIIDTIETCEAYLVDAAAAEGKDLGPFAHVFAGDSVAFARKQIAFEKSKLRILAIRELAAEQAADQNGPAPDRTVRRLVELEAVLERWSRDLRGM